MWQCTTIQFDFNEPERFGMTYTAEDGAKHRPYMVHRALLGSLERFFGILIEHYGGNFPLWICPVQVAVMNITDAQAEYARQLEKKLQAAGLRVKLNLGGEKIGAKIRDAEMEKIHYMAIVGAKEAEAGAVSLRKHGQGDIGSMTVAELIGRLSTEVADRT
jgi:threonyl-tRNA synthetase